MIKRPEVDTNLELATMKALRGAFELRDRLLIALATGNPSITDLAYAVKVRVKEDYKIQEKVLRKREARPEYDVGHLRDIVGLRIVTLYRLDALDIIPILINAIQEPPAGGVFRAMSLEEIVVYTTNPQGDPQQLSARLMHLFSERGLGQIAKVGEAPTNYTSIHMVAWGQGIYRGEPQDIPVPSKAAQTSRRPRSCDGFRKDCGVSTPPASSWRRLRAWRRGP